MQTLSSEKARPLAARMILVTGGAGYVGSVLVRRLLAAGYRVRVLDRLLFGAASLRSLAGHPHFELLQGDCRNAAQVGRAAAGAHAVIHLAAVVGDAACAADEQLTWRTNCEGTDVVVQVCRSAGVDRMLLASTCSVYGATAGLAREDSPLNPLSLYAASKAVAERLTIACVTDRFHPTVLRLGTAFGWSFRPRFDLVVNLLAARSFYGAAIEICNRRQWRPFIHVRDIASAFCLALAAPSSDVSGQIFNTGSSRMNYPLAALSAAVLRAKPETRVVYRSSADFRNYRVSFDKIRTVLDFECMVSLQQGIREIHRRLRRRPALDYTGRFYHNHALTPAGGAPAPFAGAA